MSKNKEDSRQKYFNLRDWIVPSIVAIIISIVFVVILVHLCDIQMIELSKDMSDISITFAFTFLGFLISAYAILQTVVEGLPDSEMLKTMNVSKEEKFRKRAKMMILKSGTFQTFKNNLLRIAFLSLIFLLSCVIFKPLIYLEQKLFLYSVNGFEMLGIVFIASSGYKNLKTLFALI
jgi:hypothetical protein